MDNHKESKQFKLFQSKGTRFFDISMHYGTFNTL